MRRLVFAIGGLATLGLALLGSDRGGSTDGVTTSFIVEKTFAGSAVACSSPSADDGAFALMGHKISSGGMTYATNPATFPSNLTVSEVQSAIDSALATWNGAVGQTLFTQGGTTSGRPGFKDGVNTIGFANTKSGVVATAYGWFAKGGSQLQEFDLLLSTNYSWATNPGVTSDCGGAPGTFDLQSIVTHESGHVAGLADLYASSDNAQTMFGYVTPQEMFKRTLASGDLNGVASLYGTQPAPAAAASTSFSK